MTDLIEIKVPDIGEFEDGVDVIEIHVAIGDTVALEDSIVTLESDKASMEIPSSAAGVVQEINVSVGDKVLEGSLLLKLSVNSVVDDGIPVAMPIATPEVVAATGTSKSAEGADIQTEVVVLGAGPGGYKIGRAHV